VSTREWSTLSLTISDGVAHVELTRPEKLNCFDDDLHDEFTEVIDQLSQSRDARALLLTSTGRAFSAGGDANWMREVNSDPIKARYLIDRGHRLFTSFLGLRIPVVTAVQGAAMGLGANIAFGSDIVIALRGAKLADSHVRMGLVAGDGGVVVWPQAGGMMRAKRHLLTGDPITADEARAADMITEVVDTEAELLSAARGYAERLAALPPLAVQGTKQALSRLLLQRAGEVFELSLQLERETMTSADLMEATAAFLEKRTGNYEGR
jgi:enoyl-CoA hydratase